VRLLEAEDNDDDNDKYIAASRYTLLIQLRCDVTQSRDGR